MSLLNKLNRMKQHIVREEAPSSLQKESETPIANEAIWDGYDTKIFTYDGQYCFIREITYPLTFQHGKYQLGEFHRIVHMWNESQSTHPLSCKGHQANELFFFDTETTGLGGGVGNTIFLLGQAQVFHDRVVVKQHLLPNPGNEVALYQSFLNGINSKTLVTYNGKAFDWPQVKTRHTLIRDSVPSLPPFGHFDLFHAARRLWKKEMDSVKLANVEKFILDIHRKDDVPGYLAPMIYFQFVKQQQPEIIMGVLKHNEIDVLSLITLYIDVSLKLLNTTDEANEEEHYEIARWLDYIGDGQSAVNAYQTLMEKGTRNEGNAKYQIALHYKKNKNWDMAINTWKEVLSLSNEEKLKINSAIELAKYYEHNIKNYAEAIYYTKLANQILEHNRMKDSIEQQAEIEKRLARIERKYKKIITRGSAKNE